MENFKFIFHTELFEVKPRSSAMALGSLSSWTCNFLVGMCFLPLKNLMGASVFLIFAVVCLVLTTFLKFYMPETRGKDISEVTVLVADGFRSRPLEKNHLTRINNEIH